MKYSFFFCCCCCSLHTNISSVCVSFLSFSVLLLLLLVLLVVMPSTRITFHTKTDKHKGSLNGINIPRTMIHCNEWKVCWIHHNNAISFTHMHSCNRITLLELISVCCCYCFFFSRCMYLRTHFSVQSLLLLLLGLLLLLLLWFDGAICTCSRIGRKPMSMPQ